MRMTKRKKEIMNLFEADNLDWVTSEIGAPPFDVVGVAYMLNGMDSFDKKSIIESARRTLNSMVTDGLLKKYRAMKDVKTVCKVLVIPLVFVVLLADTVY